MKNAAYWRGRFAILEQAAHKQADGYIRELEELFRDAQRSVQADIERWYGRFAANNEISLSEARRLLGTGELEEFHWTVEKYIKTGQQSGLSKEWMKKLENASAKFHVSRLEAIQTQIRQQVEVLYGSQLNGLDALLRRIARDGYTQAAYTIQKGLGIGWDITALDQRKLSLLLSKPWTTDGRTFSDRIWTKKNELIGSVQKELTQGLLRGDSPRKITDAIQQRFKVSRYQAGRLVHTETSYFNAVSTLQAYQDLGVERVEILETLDSQTCEICQQMDGKVIPLSQYEPGVTVPPFHPNCRGTTCPYFSDMDGERAARGKDGKTYDVPGDMGYEQWKKQCVKQAEEIKTAAISAAIPEFEAMQNIGLMRMPTLDKFAEMRYSKSPAYQKLLARYQNLTGERKWSAVEFNPEKVLDHYKRHGSGFGFTSVAEYNAAAVTFVNDTKDKVWMVDADGIRRFFSEKDEAFAAVYPDGTISTFFKPKAPKKYWEGQVKKYAQK